MEEISSPPSPAGMRGRPPFWASLLWLPLFGFSYFLGAILYFFAAGVVIGLRHPELTHAQLESMIQRNGMSPAGIAGMYLVQFCLLMPLVFLAAHFKTPSWRQTLAFHRFALKSLGFWLSVLIAYLLLQTLINSVFEIPSNDFLASISGTRSLALALVVTTLAPVLEELLFRGYLFTAWRHTRLGLPGTLLLTSALFVGLHANQYHWVHLTFVFMLAAILGLSREKTGSIWVPVILHGANNLISAVFVIYLGIL
jgi:membrane protease YdiL (CAAX protease family)